MEERRSVGGGELAGESLARTQVSTVAQGCYGAPVIRLPRHVVNRVVTVLPIPCARPTRARHFS